MNIETYDLDLETGEIVFVNSQVIAVDDEAVDDSNDNYYNYQLIFNNYYIFMGVEFEYESGPWLISEYDVIIEDDSFMP